MEKIKGYDDVIAEIVRVTDYTSQILWEAAGPPQTAIKNHAMFRVGSTLLYCQDYKAGEGWEIFVTACDTNRVSDTMDAVIEKVLDNG